MRNIQVSTDVFARIWSLRAGPENTEDEILRRVLWRNPGSTSSFAPSTPPTPTSHGAGIYDRRFNVTFPEGFRVERTYLGRKYCAVVHNGAWIIEGVGAGYTRLNELSNAIGTKTENAWANWFYRDETGQRNPASNLRDPATITRKSTDGAKPKDMYGEEELQTTYKREEKKMASKIRWCDDVKTALEEMGGQASLHRIYKRVAEIRKAAGRSVPDSLEATIRRTLEDFSSDSDNYRGADWFCMPEGKGSGVWALRK